MVRLSTTECTYLPAISPLHSQRSATASAGRKKELATLPLCSWRPRRGRNGYVTPTFSGVHNAMSGGKIRIGYLTLAFLGAKKRTESLRSPCICGCSQSISQNPTQKE